MAWNDSGETIVAGSGQVYVAPVGTALPATAAAAPNAAFEGLGYHTEEGVSVNQSVEIAEFRAWQSKYVIRRIRDTEDFMITFVLLQWNESTLPFAMGGGDIVSDGGSGYRYNPPGAEDDVDDRALICDVIDGSRRGRFVVPRGSVTEAVEASFTRTEMATLPITFKAQQPADGALPWYFLTNDSAAFAAGS